MGKLQKRPITQEQLKHVLLQPDGSNMAASLVQHWSVQDQARASQRSDMWSLRDTMVVDSG